MTAFVKPMLMSALGVGCLAVAGGAQVPAPPAALPPPAEPPAVFYTQAAPAALLPASGQPALVRTSQGGTLTVNGFGGYPGNEARVWGAFGGSPEDGKAQQLTKKLLDAKSDEEKDKLRGEIKTALEKAFGDRQKRHEDQIKQLEDQLKKLKKMVGERQDAKADIIADRMKQLEREAKGLGW